MDFLPDPKQAERILAKMNADQEKEQMIFVNGVDLKEVADCKCTSCPSEHLLAKYDFCCRSLFLHPLLKKGEQLKNGLHAHLRDGEDIQCVTEDRLFTQVLISDAGAEVSAALYAYQNGHVAKDQNEAWRHGCYRAIVAKLLGPLGRGVRVRLPACVIHAVRQKWPSADGSYTGFKPSDLFMERRKCVVCDRKRYQTEMHRFTEDDKKRTTWINAVRSTPEGRRRLTALLSSSKLYYLCSNHFSPSDFTHTSNSVILRFDAVPSYQDPTVSCPPTVLSPTCFTPPSPLHSSSSAGHPPPPPLSRPPPLLTRPIPPCCRCCCRPEKKSEQLVDPNWVPAAPQVDNLPSSEYLVVSTQSLLTLLSKCTACTNGENSLSFYEEGMAVSCKGQCNQCGRKFTWRSSPVLSTSNASSKEKLPKVNVDVVTGAVITAVGGTKLRQVLMMSGISHISATTFHQLKKHYVIPAVDELFYKYQGALLESIRKKVEQGWQIHLSGDGSFDSRGYSASWCRYFLLDAETGEVLHYILIHKSETGSSSTLEVAALEQGLKELSLMIGGSHGIASLVTDRHKAVTKMMKQKFPGIKHFYDPWHFFRNITMTLLAIVKPKYMTKVRFWVKPIINRLYDAVLSAQGNGDIAAEKFRAIILCMTNQHEFHQDPSFKYYKKCTHSPAKNPNIYIPKGGNIQKRLLDQVFTERNIEDIKSVSWQLQTSPCESINALAWRFSPKDQYFIRSGHQLRSRLTVLHWNHLKQTVMDGSRPVVSKKSYTNPTHKTKVWRNVRKTALHPWREEVKKLTYEIRERMMETPDSADRKRKAALRKRMEEVERLTRPVTPSDADPNLEDEWTSDEEDEDDGARLPSLSAHQLLHSLIDSNLEDEADEEEEEDIINDNSIAFTLLFSM